MPKCQFSTAGDGGAAAARERPYFILRKQSQKKKKKNATGRRTWLENRKDESKKGKEMEAEKIMGMGRENK